MTQMVLQKRKFVLYADLHGHFRKKNIFMFGCHNGIYFTNYLTSTDDDPEMQHHEKIFPYLLSQLDPNFSYAYSNYKVIYELYYFKFEGYSIKERMWTCGSWKRNGNN